MQIQIDFHTGLPVYLQIMEGIQHSIASGELPPESQLPTVRQLAHELKVNFNTVARAYRLLDEAGLISTQHGRGTYVLSLPSVEAKEKLQRKALAALVRRFLADTDRLGLSPEEVRRELELQGLQKHNQQKE